MNHELAFRTALAAGLGIVAAAGNLLGGYFVVYRNWSRRMLHAFLALGAGYMLAVAFLEIIPESIRLAGDSALLYVLIGFFVVQLFEQTVASVVLDRGQTRRNAIRAAGLLGVATMAGVFLTSALQGELPYALPLSGGVTTYVAATDLLPEVNREPSWLTALLVFAGVVSVLIIKHLMCI